MAPAEGSLLTGGRHITVRRAVLLWRDCSCGGFFGPSRMGFANTYSGECFPSEWCRRSTRTPTDTQTRTPAGTATPTATFTPTPTPTLTPSPTATLPPEVMTTTTIDYAYDPLRAALRGEAEEHRLIEASYDAGEFFRYSYDAVGNRLSQETATGTNAYEYDAARGAHSKERCTIAPERSGVGNRLTAVDSVAYIWDANGNLLSDGVATYAYDHANRLTAVSGQPSAFSFAYNGLGDRLQHCAAPRCSVRGTVDGITTDYTLDLVAGLTQVLADGQATFSYGLGRIAQHGPAGAQYFLGDALASVRQLTDQARQLALAQAYEPFGDPLLAAGHDGTPYGYREAPRSA